MNVFDDTEKNVSREEAQGVTEEVSKNQSESDVLEENEQPFVAESEDQKTDESFEDEERVVEYYPNGKKRCERISRKGSSEVTMLCFCDDEVTVSDIVLFENGKPTKVTSFYLDGKTKESETEYGSVEDAFKTTFFDEQGNFQEIVYIIGDRAVSKEEYEQAILKHKEQEETEDQEQSETKDFDEKVQETEKDEEQKAKAEEEAKKKAEEEKAKTEEEARTNAEEEKTNAEDEREAFFAERGISADELAFFDEYERRKRSLDLVLFGRTDEAKITGLAGRKGKSMTEAEALAIKYSTYTSTLPAYLPMSASEVTHDGHADEELDDESALVSEDEVPAEEKGNDEEKVKKENLGETEPGEE